MAAPSHRNVSSIRSANAGVKSQPGAAPESPRTPIRNITSAFGSPSALRSEEEALIVDIGCRYLRAGLSGDATPKALIAYGPDQQRRRGDYRHWTANYEKDWRQRVAEGGWGQGHELWKLDMRNLDLALVGDKIERAMREALTRWLHIGTQPRRLALVLPSTFPLPLLSTIMDTFFTNFQSLSISLYHAPTFTTFGAGLRSALVVDIGWNETTVSAICEYREILHRRTVRASKLLCQETLKVIGNAYRPTASNQDGNPRLSNEKELEQLISFEECEDVMTRLAWCKPSDTPVPTSTTSKSPHIEDEEFHDAIQDLSISEPEETISIPLTSTQPPTLINIPFSKLAGPCEVALFAQGAGHQDIDDEENPLHQLIYRSLMELPVEVRSLCMARILITGGGSNIPGLKNRILGDLHGLVEARGWDPVYGQAAEKLKLNKKLRNQARRNNDGEGAVPAVHGSAPRAAHVNLERDPIEEQIQREASKGSQPSVHGSLRVLDTIGAWAGTSLATNLKIPSVSVVERDQWLLHGLAGATKQKDFVPTTVAKQRQSMGPAGLRGGPAEPTAWTLGPWA